MTSDIDPGPVPEHDVPDVTRSFLARLDELVRQAQEAHDMCRWPDVYSFGGLNQLADAGANLALVTANLAAAVVQIAHQLEDQHDAIGQLTAGRYWPTTAALEALARPRRYDLCPGCLGAGVDDPGPGPDDPRPCAECDSLGVVPAR